MQERFLELNRLNKKRMTKVLTAEEQKRQDAVELKINK
jgi:uncharacterized protein YnzC (UPF0291/DUF896 family)